MVRHTGQLIRNAHSPSFPFAQLSQRQRKEELCDTAIDSPTAPELHLALLAAALPRPPHCRQPPQCGARWKVSGVCSSHFAKTLNFWATPEPRMASSPKTMRTCVPLLVAGGAGSHDCYYNVYVSIAALCGAGADGAWGCVLRDSGAPAGGCIWIWDLQFGPVVLIRSLEL